MNDRIWDHMSKSHDCIECLAKSWKDGDIDNCKAI